MSHDWNTCSFYTEKYSIDSNSQGIRTVHSAFDQPHIERFRHICNAQSPFKWGKALWVLWLHVKPLQKSGQKQIEFHFCQGFSRTHSSSYLRKKIISCFCHYCHYLSICWQLLSIFLNLFMFLLKRHLKKVNTKSSSIYLLRKESFCPSALPQIYHLCQWIFLGWISAVRGKLQDLTILNQSWKTWWRSSGTGIPGTKSLLLLCAGDSEEECCPNVGLPVKRRPPLVAYP